MITGFYTGLLALLLVPMIVMIVKRRMAHKVSLGTGGVEDLERYVRAHGNFAETVPIALVLMLVNELSGAPLWSIHVLGVLLVCGRVIHYLSLTKMISGGPYRQIGMGLTITVFILGGLGAIFLYAKTLF